MPKKIFATVLLGGLIFFACASYPRYTSETVRKEERQVVGPKGTEESDKAFPLRRKSKSKIDQAKMGRIINSFLGTPYKLGGTSRAGIDCSGLVVEVYREYAGFTLPQSTKKLYQLVKKVDKEDLVYGDLVFFSDGWFSVSHVGIYTKDGKFVHSMKGFGVIVSSLDERYYKKRYRGARRVIP